MTLTATPSPPVMHQQVEVQVVADSIHRYFYDVRFFNEGDGSSGLDHRIHRVGKDRRCTCPAGADCPAVTAVAEYLKAGGERAPDPPPGYYPVAPAACPVCQAETVYDLHLSSKRRGAGWRCCHGDSHHYWQAQVRALRQKLEANPWLFAPVVLRKGQRMLAYDGIEPDDTVLYPGVRRSEIVTDTTTE